MDSPSHHTPSGVPGRSRFDLVWAAGAAVVVTLVARVVTGQGLDLLHDGLLLVGADRLAAGATLYRDVFVPGGPAPYVLLAAAFGAFGTSAAVAALVDALLLGLLAAVGTLAARRSGAGASAALVPVAALATLGAGWDTTAILLMTVVTGRAARGRPGTGAALALGLGWGAASWFGLGTLVAGVVIGGGVLTLAGRVDRRSIAAFAVGLVAAAAVPFAWALATGSTAVFAEALGTGLRSGGGPTEFVRAHLRPFAGLATGETLEAAWPAQAIARTVAVIVGLFLAGIAPPVALVIAVRRGRDSLLVALALFGLACGVGVLLGGGGAAWAGAVTAGVVLLLAAGARRGAVVRAALLGLVLVAVLPLAAETVWLAANVDREGLATWERERAGVALTAERIASLEDGFGELGDGPRIETVFWPAAPALNFVFDLPPGHPRTALVEGLTGDADAVVDALDENPPKRLVVLREEGVDLRSSVPSVWEHLRKNTRVESTVVDSGQPAWILRPVYEGWALVQQLPPAKRLPAVFHTTADRWSPRLGEETRVAQTFRMGDSDLNGLQVRWLTLSTGFRAPVEIVVWSVDGGRLFSPLHALRTEVFFDAPQKTSVFTFDPVPGTAGRDVAIEFRVPPEVRWPIHLMWHDHEGEADPFPAGTALVDGEAVPADLYFVAY